MIKGIFAGFLYVFVNACYNFFSIPLLLNYFGKGKFGLIGLALSINLYLRILDSGFSIGNVKFFASYLTKNDELATKKLFQTNLGLYGLIGILNTIVIIIITVFSKKIFQVNDGENEILQQLLIIIVSTTLGVWISNVLEQFLKGKELVGWVQNILTAVKIIQILLIILVIYFDISLINYFLLNTLASLLILIPYIYRIKKEVNYISFYPKIHKDILKEILPYSLGVLGFVIFQFSANHFRPIILGIRAGVESVTDYRVIEGFGTLILSICGVFLNILLPKSTSIKTLGDKKKELEFAHDGTKYITIFIALIIFGLVLVTNEILTLYVGVQYIYLELWFNIWIISLLSAHNYVLSSLVLADNKLKTIVISSAIIVPISLLIGWLLTPTMGVGGAVLGFTFYQFFQTAFYYFYYYPIIMGYNSKKIFFQSFLKPSFIIFVGFLLIKGVKYYYPIESPLISIIVYELIYVITLLTIVFTVILNKKDIVLIKESLPFFQK